MTITKSAALLAGAPLAFAAQPAAAHSAERGFVMLLPTGLYLLGGALAVALSFVVMAVVSKRAFERGLHWQRSLGSFPVPTAGWGSAFGLALAIALVAAGFAGTRDPLENPLPAVVWTLWWVGFTLLVAALGDLWCVLNPWRSLYRAVCLLPGARQWRAAPPVALPAALGYAPALAAYVAFAWFENIHPAPADPEILAWAALGYGAWTLAGMLAFGEAAWLERAEAFSVFFRMVGWLSPLAVERLAQAPRRARLTIGVPCRGLLSAGRLPASAALFVLFALASVSFDGLLHTFWWLGLIGENPLEYPGRSSLMGVNSLGIAVCWLALTGVYAFTVRAGASLVGGSGGFGGYVVSIVPIAFGYHFAHYLTSFLVEAQHALRALSDPLGRGWNLIGFRDWHVTASFLNEHDSVHAIWNLQVATIVLAHVAAVCVAHAIALREHGDARKALRSQVPLTVFMVAYTVFGLWLLSTPVAG